MSSREGYIIKDGRHICVVQNGKFIPVFLNGVQYFNRRIDGATRLRDKPIGSLVTLMEGGTLQNYVVVHQGSPSAIYRNFENTTTLMRYLVTPPIAFDARSISDFQNSSIRAHLYSTYLQSLGESIRQNIVDVRIPFRSGATGQTILSGDSGLLGGIFLPSFIEVGGTTASFTTDAEGARFSFFDPHSNNDNAPSNSARQAYCELDQITRGWWLRSAFAPNNTTSDRALTIRPAGMIQDDLSRWALASGTNQPVFELATYLLGRTIGEDLAPPGSSPWILRSHDNVLSMIVRESGGVRYLDVTRAANATRGPMLSVGGFANGDILTATGRAPSGNMRFQWNSGSFFMTPNSAVSGGRFNSSHTIVDGNNGGSHNTEIRLHHGTASVTNFQVENFRVGRSTAGSSGIRPCIVLPDNTIVDEYNNIG